MRLIGYYFILAVCYGTSVFNIYSISFDDYPQGWIGDTALFVKDENGGLLLNAPEEPGDAYLFYPSEVINDAVWNLRVLLDFNPSASNYMKIYLATDGQKDFENGYYLIIGTTRDNITLWERVNGEDHLLIDGTEKLLDHAQVELDIRVTRQTDGHWKLEVNDGNGWVIEGEAFSSFGFGAKWFGLSCHYTKTRADKFYLLDISITGSPYPFNITNFQVANGYTLLFEFSDTLSSTYSQPVLRGLNFELPSIANFVYGEDLISVKVDLINLLPDIKEGQLFISGWCSKNGQCIDDTILIFSYQSPKVLQFYAEGYYDLFLSFNLSLPEGLLQPDNFNIGNGNIKVSEILDLKQGNYRLRLNRPIGDAEETICYIENLTLPNGDVIPYGPYQLYYHEAAPFDIVFSEIMHDPSPQVLLPEVEYLELYNRSELPVDLKNMILSINGNKITLESYLLFPNEYVVITQNDAVTSQGRYIPEKWVPLNNMGGELVLYNPSGIVVAAFRYPSVLESDNFFKQQGGWSMELIDPDNLSNDLSNWAYSTNNRGGTPGEPNSVTTVNPDFSGPMLVDSWLENDSVLTLAFSEPIKYENIVDSGFSLTSNGLDIERILWDSIFKDQVSVEFNKRLIPHQVERLNLPSNVSDLTGNLFYGEPSLFFGLPGQVDSFDVVINELLFDPPVNGYEYVELYNRSDKIAALDSLCLARNGPNNQPDELFRLSDRIRWFLPDQHLCFTNNAEWVKSNFICEAEDQLVELSKFPNFYSDGGVVFLTSLNGHVIDRFDYSPDYHFELLAETKGVALERISYDAITNSPMSWQSASSMVGYGTPTGKNSQYVETSSGQYSKLLELTPKVFTPDLDGVDDFLIVNYTLGIPGQKGTFIIYDIEGRPVKHLINNQTLSTSGKIIWDGITDDHTLAPPGIYVIWCRIFDLNGNVREFKDSFVLGVKAY